MPLTPEVVDKINGSFECIGAISAWMNVRELYKDKIVKGVYWPNTFFFAIWGIWNLYYYPALGQWTSFWGGLFLVSGSLTWVIMALLWRNKNG